MNEIEIAHRSFILLAGSKLQQLRWLPTAYRNVLEAVTVDLATPDILLGLDIPEM